VLRTFLIFHLACKSNVRCRITHWCVRRRRECVQGQRNATNYESGRMSFHCGWQRSVVMIEA
jgi:hypothetical protein